MSSQLQEAQSALVAAGDRLDGAGRSVVESLDRQINEAETILVSANERLAETGRTVESTLRNQIEVVEGELAAAGERFGNIGADAERGIARQIERIDAAVEAGNMKFGASGDRLITDLNRQLVGGRQLAPRRGPAIPPDRREVGAGVAAQIALIDTSVEMAKQGLDTTGEKLVVEINNQIGAVDAALASVGGRIIGDINRHAGAVEAALSASNERMSKTAGTVIDAFGGAGEAHPRRGGRSRRAARCRWREDLGRYRPAGRGRQRGA